MSKKLASFLFLFIFSYGNSEIVNQVNNVGNNAALIRRSLRDLMIKADIENKVQGDIEQKLNIHNVLHDSPHRRFVRHVGDYAIADESYSSFGHEHQTKRRPYKQPGEWVTPAPDSGVDLGFTPVQTYIQVRKTNTVHHLPRSEAYKEATSEDELLNSHRLKEVLRTKKIQEVYSEEGYEDSAYDHGDEERQAEHSESFNKHKHGRYNKKGKSQDFGDNDDAESNQILVNNNTHIKEYAIPKSNRKKAEISNLKHSYMSLYEKKYSTPKKEPKKFDSLNKRRSQTLKKSNKPRKTPKRDFATQKADIWAFPTPFEDISVVNKWSVNLEQVPTFKGKDEQPDSNKVKIPPQPTFGFIHSLTDAHYGNQATAFRHTPKSISSHVINLTDGFRKAENEKFVGFEPKRIKKRVKRDVSDDQESEEYERDLSKQIDALSKDIIESSLQGQTNFGSNFENAPVKKVLPATFSTEFQPLFDSSKYPNYYRTDIDPYSPLRYATNSNYFPKKIGRRMEFYENRDSYINCEPISVNLNDVPKSNSTKHLKEQPGEKKRIIKLGDKIQCLKNKYFDKNPLDSPFFKEDLLEKRNYPNLRSDSSLKYHSSYEYQPNKTMDVFVTAHTNDSKVEGSEERFNYQTVHTPNPQSQNATVEDFRVIPVKEPEITTPGPILGMKPPPKLLPYLPFSVIRLPAKPKAQKLRKMIRYRYDCLQPVTKMTISERNDEIIYNCRDVTLIHSSNQGHEHFQIIPKVKRSDVLDSLMDEFNVIRAGEVFESRRKRAAENPNERRRSNLFPNKKYLDRIIKRPTITKKGNESTTTSDVQKSEIKQFTTSPVTTTTMKPVETSKPVNPSQEPNKLEARPLKRLSGQDFLNRYHKAKRTNSLGEQSPSAFWKVPQPPNKMLQPTGSRKIKRDDYAIQNNVKITRRNEPYVPPMLYYIVDSTGMGRWITRSSRNR